MENVTERVARLEANAKTIFHQLDEIKAVVNDVHSLATSVQLIAQKSTTIEKKVDTIDKRLGKVEGKPGEDYRHYKRMLVGCIFAEMVGMLLGAAFAWLG